MRSPLPRQLRHGARISSVDLTPLPQPVDRAVVEEAIAATLHADSCGDETYAGDPHVAEMDVNGHARDARVIVDAIVEHGWRVVRDA